MVLTGYVVPGCVEDGAWMLLGNSSVVVAAAVVVLARLFLDKFSKSRHVQSFLMKNDFRGHLFLRMSFFKIEFPPKACAPAAKGFLFWRICSTFNDFL